MKAYKARDVVNILKKDGWYLVKIKGSHHQFKHPTKKGKVTVPYSQKSECLKLKTVKAIFKQAEIKF